MHDQCSATMSLVPMGGGLVFGGDVNGCFTRLTRRPARETGDDVLVSRYEQLLAYFSERARLWRARRCAELEARETRRPAAREPVD